MLYDSLIYELSLYLNNDRFTNIELDLHLYELLHLTWLIIA